MNYLCLSMRHLQLEQAYAYNWQDMFYYRSRRLDLGEGIYTLNTSNLRWPDDVTYPEMMQARKLLTGG